ncbi:LuxR family transcriptional regulator [Cognatishimia sp. MH4019]|uniref:LuxR family transcriptional regulator n=1 Tax=Cognatishimia sp. MH4019 TaxID=2854030 RepID=UPI001CD43D2C|nr:LuxR family transcriptional regulator [Cognatishimia sp. MH4019]
MAQDDLSHLIATIRDATDTSDLWQIAINFFNAHGIIRVSYHVYGEGGGDPAGQSVRTDGFPRDWVSTYIEGDYAVVDPIPELARLRSRPFLWSEVERLHPISEDARDFLEAFRDRNLGDGLAMQVFGPNLRNAYVGLGFGAKAPDLSDAYVSFMQIASQALHLRYCELTEAEDQRPADLSPRELEVLKWIARGKSNSVISELMSVSPHTVDTLVRRLFSKLKVSDRTSAAIKGIGAGFLHKGELKD